MLCAAHWLALVSSALVEEEEEEEEERLIVASSLSARMNSQMLMRLQQRCPSQGRVREHVSTGPTVYDVCDSV